MVGVHQFQASKIEGGIITAVILNYICRGECTCISSVITTDPDIYIPAEYIELVRRSVYPADS